MSFDRARDKDFPWWPVLLPDGKHFLYLTNSVGSSDRPRKLWVGSLESGEPRPLVSLDSRVAYLSPGYLLFARGGMLLAQPFDTEVMRLNGDPITVGEDVWFNGATGNAAFSASETGTVAFGGRQSVSRLVWRDRKGRAIGAVGTPAIFHSPRLSPDGAKLALDVFDAPKGSYDIWIYDVVRGVAQRFTAGPKDAVSAVWSPEGDRILFSSSREGPPDLYIKRFDGAGREQLLLKQVGVQFPSDWSPDGTTIVYEDISLSGASRRSLWVLPLDGSRKPVPLLSTNFSTFDARYSPDGRWIAFASEESGRAEVYVMRANGGGGLSRVSTSGGSQPHWRHDGRELFYLSTGGELLALPMRPDGLLQASEPQVLFAVNPAPEEFEVTADGSRFLFREQEPDAPFTVVVDLAAELKKR